MDGHQKQTDQAMDSHHKICWFTNDPISGIEQNNPATVVLQSQTHVIAKLIVGADGANSQANIVAVFVIANR